MHESLILQADISCNFYGNIEESREFVDESNCCEVYGGWKIILIVPNGGILGFDILNHAYDVWMGEDTSESFDYLDRDGIITHAKEAIDKIEQAIATCNGQQLALFEV